MAKINFKQFKMFVDIAHERSVETDARKDFADAIYGQANGVMALDLAMRIYKSDGPIEFSDDDLGFLRKFVEGFCSARFIDSFEANISND